MLKTLTDEEEADRGAWLPAFWKGELEWKGRSEVTGSVGEPLGEWKGPPYL